MADSIKCQGVLEKQGRLKTWAWKKYWFVLQDEQLTYFKEDKRSSSQGLINMASAQSVRSVKSNSKGYQFEIVSKTRTHVLMASTAELGDKWVKYLQQAMTLLDRKSLLRHQSMSTTSCNSISDDEEVVYSSIDDAEVFHGHEKPVIDAENNLIVENDIYQGFEEEENLYAEIHPQQHHSIKSQDSLYQDAKRQHQDLKRICEPSPRHAPLLRRTRLAQLEPSSSLSSGFYDSGNTDCDDDDSESSLTPAATDEAELLQEAAAYAEVAPIVRPRSLTFDCNFTEVPDLPHPRRELVWDTPFDQIRSFIAKHRTAREFYPAQKGVFNGVNIEALRSFLCMLDFDKDLEDIDEEEDSPVIEVTAL